MRIAHIDTTEEVLVVAEVGNNHEGDFDTAQELVRQASKAGAHAVKFQTFKAELYVSASDEARFRQLKSFELSYEQFERLAELAHSLGLIFISTPFDLESAAFLAGQIVRLRCFGESFERHAHAVVVALPGVDAQEQAKGFDLFGVAREGFVQKFEQLPLAPPGEGGFSRAAEDIHGGIRVAALQI